MQLKFILKAAALLVLGFTGFAQAGASFPPLQTVERVELCQYLGKWYEIARLPNSFQEGCMGTAAEYSVRDDGDIEVVNSCRDAKDGRLRQAKGKAWVVDTVSNAKLKVSFFWPFRGDYWIIDLGKDYEYAVVGTPDRKYLWVLSRTAVMPDDVYSALLLRAAKQGFDTARVTKESEKLQ
jgi:apolipoprotein D and lipocalin family protein